MKSRRYVGASSRKNLQASGFALSAFAMSIGRLGITGFGPYVFSVGGAARPARAKRPAAFSSIHRLRLIGDHLLVGCRGVTLIAYRSSSRRLIRLSIQPKHS